MRWDRVKRRLVKPDVLRCSHFARNEPTRCQRFAVWETWTTMGISAARKGTRYYCDEHAADIPEAVQR